MKMEDTIGRLAMLSMTYALLVTKASTFFHYQDFSLVDATRMLSITFLALMLFFTVIRMPPIRSAQGLEPRVTSIAGSYTALLLVFTPPANLAQPLQLLAFSLVALGTGSAIVCLSWLGRSFSTMATARRLVVSGPYSIVRHPLYLCEGIFVLGLVINHLSFLALVLFAVQMAFQARRMMNEERILRETFPEYDDYRTTVPMLIPRFLQPSPKWLAD